MTMKNDKLQITPMFQSESDRKRRTNHKLNSKTIKIGKNQKKTIVITESGNYTIELVGENASVDIVGAFVGLRADSFTVKTLQHHKAPHTTSNLLIKSVLLGKSTFSYDGLIKIDQQAQQSNAYQRNENLLLSSNAHVDTKPELEILANDVRCTHGVTIGRVSDASLFYLMSRGLTRKEATNLLIEGFFAPVLTKITDKNRKRRLLSRLVMV